MKKIYIIAAIAALAAGVFLYLYLDGLNEEVAVEIQYESVVIAAEDIPAYTVISAEMVTVAPLPLGSAHALAARSVSEVVGLTTESAILSGEQLLTAKLRVPGESASGLAYVIPEGMRAMTIAVDEVTGVSSLIRQGDYVDVVAHIATTFASPETVVENADGTTTVEPPVAAESTLIAADNVLVAALNGEMTEHPPVEGESTKYAYVTLIVTTEEAMRITEGYRFGQLTLLLRASGEHGFNPEPPINADTLITAQTAR